MKHKFLICLVLALGPICSFGQSHKKTIEKFQKELNQNYSDPETSPLPKEQIKSFNGLPFFPINEKYKVEAKFEKLPPASPYKMKTSDKRLRDYDLYAKVTFELDGREFQLNVYQISAANMKALHQNRLFLPFTDQSNGTDTYGGGRYLDFEIPEGDRITIDFNKAYNPYCAYSDRYSCPIPRQENDLEISISAGVKYASK